MTMLTIKPRPVVKVRALSPYFSKHVSFLMFVHKSTPNYTPLKYRCPFSISDQFMHANLTQYENLMICKCLKIVSIRRNCQLVLLVHASIPPIHPVETSSITYMHYSATLRGCKHSKLDQKNCSGIWKPWFSWSNAYMLNKIYYFSWWPLLLS